jgi:hypothetical protein
MFICWKYKPVVISRGRHFSGLLVLIAGRALPRKFWNIKHSALSDILSRVWVNVGGVWTGNRIYWTLLTHNSWLHVTSHYHARTHTHTLLFLITVFTALLGKVFQRQMFLCSRAHVLAGWRPFHTNLLRFSLPSQDYLVITAGPRYLVITAGPRYLVMTAGPRYIASARIAQKRASPIIACSLVARETCPQNCCCRYAGLSHIYLWLV